MEQLTHKGGCIEVHPDNSHEEWEKKQNNSEEELEELVDYDGSLISSKIPLGINKANKISRSTSDDVVKTAHQKGNGFGYYYRRYWGEAYLGRGLGDNEEIDTMEDTDEVIDHFTTEYDLHPLKAAEKAAQHGFDPGEDTQRLVELAEDKMKDMLEVILKKRDGAPELVGTGKRTELVDTEESNPIIHRMATKFKNACDAEGIDPSDILNKI